VAGPSSDARAESRLAVLGTCGAWPEPGRACSGFLLEHAGFRVAVDLGYGTLSRLLAELGSAAAEGLDAVVVSHRHPDHMLDLHGLFRARSFGSPEAPALPLFSPEGIVERLKALEEDDGSKVDEVFDWQPLPAPEVDLGPFRLESRSLPHSVPSVGVRLTAATLTVAYTGDTGYVEEVAELGRDADLFVVDATDQHQQDPQEDKESETHLTARQAGTLGERAGARRLLLTHFWPGNDRERSRSAAAEEFSGELLVADEGLTIDLAT
jgi:ribonuclease BN (tRNA processing enzyme)